MGQDKRVDIGEESPLVENEKRRDSIASVAVDERASTGMWLSVLPTMLGPLLFGYSLGFTSPAMSTNPNVPGGMTAADLDWQMAMDTDTLTWFGSIISLGAGFGAVLGGFPVDRWGKRFGMVTSNLIFLVAYIIMVTTPKQVESEPVWDGAKFPRPTEAAPAAMAQLIMARLIMGFGTGLVCVATPSYQTEVATKELRGTVGTFFQIGAVTGLLIVYGLGYSLRWQALSYVAIGLSAAGALLCFFIPESPSWLMNKGRVEEAEASLRKLRDAGSDIQGALAVLREEHSTEEASQQASGLMSELCVAPRGKALLIGLGLMGLQQLCGINAVAFYSKRILGVVFNDQESRFYSLVYMIIQAVVTTASAPFMQKFGRKTMLIFATCLMILSLIVMDLYFFNTSMPPVLVIIGLYMYITAFSCGIGAITWVMCAEIFHPKIRSVATGICTAVNWLLCFVITKTLDDLKVAFGGNNDELGMGWVFALYGIVCVLCLGFVAFVVPETKGRSYSSVEKLLKGTATETAEVKGGESKALVKEDEY